MGHFHQHSLCSYIFLDSSRPCCCDVQLLIQERVDKYYRLHNFIQSLLLFPSVGLEGQKQRDFPWVIKKRSFASNACELHNRSEPLAG